MQQSLLEIIVVTYTISDVQAHFKAFVISCKWLKFVTHCYNAKCN